MANENARPQKKNKNRTQSGPRPQANDNQLSPQQRHQVWVDNKMEKAKNDDFNVIQQKTRDTAETVNFLNIVDNLMYHIRMNSGTMGSRIPEGAQDKYVKKINDIKAALNLVAAEMCRDTNRTYRPPRGYKNPLLENKPKAKEAVQQAKQAKKATVKTSAPNLSVVATIAAPSDVVVVAQETAKDSVIAKAA